METSSSLYLTKLNNIHQQERYTNQTTPYPLHYLVTSIVYFHKKVFACQPTVVVSSMSNGGDDCSCEKHTVDVVLIGTWSIYNLPTTTEMMMIYPAVFFHAVHASLQCAILYYHSKNEIIGFNTKKTSQPERTPHCPILKLSQIICEAVPFFFTYQLFDKVSPQLLFFYLIPRLPLSIVPSQLFLIRLP